MNALDGIKVVALEQAVSLPLATRHMADLGADVIKIERAEGDFARTYDSHVLGQSTYFVWLNAGKRSIALNLKTESGREIAAVLVREADVFVQNLGPGAAERLGLGAENLMVDNRGLVYCGLTGYGSRGPYRDRKAYDLLLQGEAGVISVSGTPEEPAKAGISIVDISGGMYVLVSVLAALLERDRTGRGCVLDLSLLDSIGEWMQVPYLYTRYTGRPFPRSGQRHNMIVPYGPYSCGQGESVNLAIQNEREWERLCKGVLDEPDLFGNPDYVRNEGRVKNRDILEPLIEKRFAELGLAEVERRLESAGIPFGEARDASAAKDHPQFSERNRWRRVASEGGDVTMLRAPFETAAEASGRVVPALGEHTVEILRSIGYSDEKIDDLVREEAVFRSVGQ